MRELLKKLADKYEDYRAGRGYTCDCCGREIFTYPQPRLCEDCLNRIPVITRRCPKCGRAAPTEGVCLECKERMPLFSFAISQEDMYRLETMPQTGWSGQHPDL